MSLGVSLLVALLSVSVHGQSPLVVTIADDGHFNVSVGGTPWAIGGQGFGLHAWYVLCRLCLCCCAAWFLCACVCTCACDCACVSKRDCSSVCVCGCVCGCFMSCRGWIGNNIINDADDLANVMCCLRSGAWQDVSNGGLVLLSSTPITGSDIIGGWAGRALQWGVAGCGGGGVGATWEVVVRDYTSSGACDCVVFEQRFGDELTGTSGASTNDVATVFPSLTPASALGFLSFFGNMACQGGNVSCTDIGVWSAGLPAEVKGGLFGGAPLVLFEPAVQHAIVVSPFSNFMSSQQVMNNATGVLECGIMGGVDTIPQGCAWVGARSGAVGRDDPRGDPYVRARRYSYETIVSYGPGVNAAMRAWGAALLKRSGKTTAARDADHVVNYLGYWTDNGGVHARAGRWQWCDRGGGRRRRCRWVLLL